MSRTRLGLVLLAGFPVVAASAPVPKEGTKPFVKWSVKAETVTNGFNNPFVLGNLVLVGNDRTLTAYRCKDGSRAWAHEDGKRIYHRPCSDGEQVYYSSDNGLAALAADTGRWVWTFAFAANEGGPAVVVPGKGLVVVGGADGKLHGVVAKTGEPVWKSDFLDDAPKDPPGFDGNNARMRGERARPIALSTDGEAVFLTVFDQCRVVAVEATTGKRLWSFPTGGWMWGEATAAGNHVFVGSKDHKLYCLDRKTGAMVWEFTTEGSTDSGCALDGEAVYITSSDGLYAVDRATGKQRWRFQADRTPDGKRARLGSPPILRSGYLTFAALEGQVYAVDKLTGQLRWKIRPSKDSELSGPPVTDGVCYIVTSRPRAKGVGEDAVFAIGLK